MQLFNFSRRPNVQELKSQEDVEGLIDALNYQEDHNIRLAAASALGTMGDGRAVEPLIAALDDERGVNEVAALALGEIGDLRAVEPLTKTLGDENWEVRSSAAKALGKIGDGRAVDPLVNLLGDRNENVRWHTSQALEAITGDSYRMNTNHQEE